MSDWESLGAIPWVWITFACAIIVIIILSMSGVVIKNISRNRALRYIGADPDESEAAIAARLYNEVCEMAKRGQWILVRVNILEIDQNTISPIEHQIVEFVKMFEWDESEGTLSISRPIGRDINYAELPELKMSNIELQKEWDHFRKDWKKLINTYPSLEFESMHIRSKRIRAE